MAGRRIHRYTIFDAMEERGVFEANPANIYARDEQGGNAFVRQDFPKMMYHPEGRQREVDPGEEVASLSGKVRILNQKFEIEHEIVATAEREAELRAAGWHLHPAAALRAGGHKAPEAGPAEIAQTRALAIEEELAVARSELARMREEIELAKLQGFETSEASAPKRASK